MPGRPTFRQPRVSSRWGITTALLALGLALFTHLTFAGGPTVKAGDPFPDLSKFGIEGKLPDTLKGKIVVVDFWASWCGPCKDSFPVMEELHRRFSDKGLVILAINVDESRAAMEEFLKEHPVTFSVVRDAKKKLVAAVNIASMPTSFILDADGKVHSIHNGFRGVETRKKYIKEIQALLKITSAKHE